MFLTMISLAMSGMIHIVICVYEVCMILIAVSLSEEWSDPYCDLSEEWMIHTLIPFREGWMTLTMISFRETTQGHYDPTSTTILSDTH